ncbi:MAG: HAMP domain-containing protein, partial [Pseudomonadota bacterium]|nr:HAMP domain-containing protein [Pseudomonadota bacterium]
MALLLATSVAVTAAAALALTWALGAANAQVERLASAQRRFELLSAISGRVGDYALVALQAAEGSTGGLEHLVLARDRVHQAFQRFDGEVGEAVSRLEGEAERTLVAARSRAVARMRARFDVLDRQATTAIERALLGRDGGIEALKVALDAFAAGFAPALGQAIEEERAAAHEAQAAMARLRERLTQGALVAVLLALALSVLLYRALARPLLRRVSDVAAGAAAIARGRFDTRLVVDGRDEL